ncbi:MAG: ATP phosphoribosyltransferase [Bacteroidales bacterium]
MIRIAVQSKGRLNEKSLELLNAAGVGINENKRKFLTQASNFPLEVLYMRDDDIPQTVSMGVADLGIVGFNEVAERAYDLEISKKLNFGKCRISLAIPKNDKYTGLNYFNGKKIATSYPNILKSFFKEKGINAEIHVITGSVEIAPTVGLSDAIFDIVSSGGTLVSNGLVEVEQVIQSEAVLVANKNLTEEKKKVLEQLMFRFDAVIRARRAKYMLMNIPEASIEKAIKILPALRSPTILPLAMEGWCSLHSVVDETEMWDKIDKLKAIGAEGILVTDCEKIIM